MVTISIAVLIEIISLLGELNSVADRYLFPLHSHRILGVLYITYVCLKQIQHV